MKEKNEKKGYPDRYEAEALLREAEALNPGLWGNHSRVAAKCAETIARACGDIDSEKAYVLGLLHDALLLYTEAVRLHRRLRCNA